MKNLLASILTLALLSFTTPVFAGETNQTTVANTVPPTATQVIEKFGDKLDQYINALAAKAGVAAQHFYPIFVRQQIITGVFELFLMVVGLCLSVFFLRLGYKSMQNTDDEHAEQKTFFGFVFGVIFTILTVVSIIAEGSDSLSRVCNPEYSAVQSLVQMVK